MNTIIRKIDTLGRIVIPKGMRLQLGLLEGDEIELAVNGDKIEMRAVVNRSDNERYEIAREVLRELGVEIPEVLKK